LKHLTVQFRMRNIIVIYLLAILLCVRAAQPIQGSAISDYPDESNDEDFGEENILSEIFKVIISLSKF